MRLTSKHPFNLPNLLSCHDLDQTRFQIRLAVWILEFICSIFIPLFTRNFTFLDLLSTALSHTIYLYFLFTQTRKPFLIGACYLLTKTLPWLDFIQSEDNSLSIYLQCFTSFALFSIQGFPLSLSYICIPLLFLTLKGFTIYRHVRSNSYHLSVRSIETLLGAWPVALAAVTAFLLVYQALVIQLWKNCQESRHRLEEVSHELQLMNYEILKKTEEASFLSQQVKEASKSQDLFISSVSHELRNPLNVLLGNIDVLQSEIKNSGLDQIFAACKNCGEVLLSHINNLLDVAKINGGRLEVTPFPLQVGSFLQKFWNLAGNDIKEKNLMGRLIIDKNFPPWIEIDGHRLQQVLYNLVDNSIKFTSEGSVRIIFTWISKKKALRRMSSCFLKGDETKEDTLDEAEEENTPEENDDDDDSESICSTEERKESLDMRSEYINRNNIDSLGNSMSFAPNNPIEALLNVTLQNSKPESGVIRIDVFDSGCGIAKDFQNDLFKPFAQGDASLTRQYSGTGLGLYIVKKIVEKMKGDLQVHSSEHIGTHFKVLLPARSVLGQRSELHLNPQQRQVSYQDLSQLDELEGIKRTSSVCYQDKRVLIVDDIEFNQKVMQNFFELLKFQVDIASNGLEACEKYQQDPKKYFLVTMDIQMPVMDGITACKNIRSFEKEKGVARCSNCCDNRKCVEC